MLYRCQSVPGPPMPCFVAQSFGGQRLSSRPSRRRVDGSCIGFWKSKANSTFCKVVKQKGEGKPTFSTRSFPLSLFIYPKLMESFGLLLKMRCIFFTEQSCGDQGSPPGPPMPCFVARSFGCGTELRFGSLCNLGLSKKLRFSLQRHKT